jgi:hypothetical protein
MPMADITRREFLRKASNGAIVAGAGASLGLRAGEALAETVKADAAAPGPRRRSFSFLHTYEATGRYRRGIEKAGLVRPGTGVRLVNSPFGDDDSRRFNAVARVGGELYRIIRDAKCHFVIDRVAGGSPYHAYDFDAKLIDAYASMLGEKFLGGQVHEVLSNVNNDWGRICKADRKFETEPVRPDEMRSYFTWDSADRWIEYGTLDDYAGRVKPRTTQALWKEIEWAGKRQAARFGGHWSYCEGSVRGELAWHIFYKWGAAYGLAEVGPWASTQTQFAVASLRGSAKAAGRPWGVFFAPWGPGGCTSFIPERDWSWNCPKKWLDDSKWPVSPEVGPSTALQRRIFFHAYLSGAHTLHEEWGAEGNLTNWDEGTLSSYGRVTRDLLDFQDAHPDVGEPYTPLALVLGASIPPPDAGPWAKVKAALFRDGEAEKAVASRPAARGQELACYPSCAVPEVFDVVPSDAPKEVWSQYKTVINIGDGQASVPPGAEVYPVGEPPARVLAAAKELSPFARSTHMPMQVNHRTADRAWIVALYNPWGARRGDVCAVGSILDEGCTMRDTLHAKFRVKSAKAIHAWPAGSGVKARGDELDVAVGPGGTLVIEVRK